MRACHAAGAQQNDCIVISEISHCDVSCITEKEESIMMGRLRAMREPLKYVQGRNALLKFQEEMGYMGTRWLFVCSKSGYRLP